MGKILVVAEKPSVARDIAKVLKCTSKGQGYLYGEQYVVSWAIGHLVTLCEPEDYSSAYKKWDAKTLPIIPAEIKLKAIPNTEAQLITLRKLMNAKDIDYIICATDSGREGELIFRYIYKITACKKSFKRLWISSMTDAAIKDGFKNLKDSTEYDLLYSSAKSRSEADWLVGINATRAYTITYGALLTIGRVQTPTLAILVSRQKEINSFVPETYYEVEADFGDYKGIWFIPDTNDSKIKDIKKAKEISDKVLNQTAVVKSVDNQEKKNPPPLLYDLTELQRDCNRRYGLSAQKTLDIAQSLYEKRKMITYPRTDSRYLSSDYVPKIHLTLNKLNFGNYTDYVKYIKSLDKLPITKRIVDNTKITDHHAIVPTDGNAATIINSLTTDEKKVYDLIVRRFLSVFYPAHVFNVTKVITEAVGELFLSKGNMIIKIGWMELYEDDIKKDKEPSLPVLKPETQFTVKDSKVMKKKTKAPNAYNEATLLSAMENAGRQIEDEALKEQMKDSGLGTPATRAGIIERLLQVGYVERKGKVISPTEKGMTLVDIVPDELKTPETTGKWEKGLSAISKGTMDSQKFMSSITRYVNYLVNDSKTKKPNVIINETPNLSTNKKLKSLGKCPLCNNSEVYENSKSFYCGNWKAGCKFTMWKNSIEKYRSPLDSDMAKILLTEKIINKIPVTLPQTGEKGTADLILKGTNKGELELINFVRD